MIAWSRRRAAVVATFLATVAGGCASAGPATVDGSATAVSIDGVERFDDLARDHVDGPVDYDQEPPVGGPHAAVWQTCGAYDEPIADPNGVHSMEHGAVWITFDPDLPDEQVNQLLGRAAVSTHVLVSPRARLPSPVVASAWGVQLSLPDANDDRLDAFLDAHVQGPQTPEPGATCAGGLGSPS